LEELMRLVTDRVVAGESDCLPLGPERARVASDLVQERSVSVGALTKGLIGSLIPRHISMSKGMVPECSQTGKPMLSGSLGLCA